MADQSYPDLCKQMISDLEAQLPLAKDGEKAGIRRMITHWRQASRRPVVELKDTKPKKKSPNPIKWALRTCR